MSVFKSITIQGAEYNFEHLVPITIEVTAGKDAQARTYKVLVNFSCHCFTQELDDQIHTPDYHYVHENERRAFCPVRYELSRGLPDIIREIGNKRVYFTWERNYVYIEQVDDQGEVVPYTIFFDVKRGNKGVADVVMTIVSAYAKPGMARQASPIRFPMLIAKTARGEKPTISKPGGIR